MSKKLESLIKKVLEELQSPGPFKCNNCPKNDDKERGPWCPAWGKILLTKHVPGGQSYDEVEEACYFERMEKWHEGIRYAFSMNIESINEARQELGQYQDSVPKLVATILLDPASRRFIVNQEGAINGLPSGKNYSDDQRQIPDFDGDSVQSDDGCADSVNRRRQLASDGSDSP